MSSSFCMLPYDFMYLFIHISRDFLKVVVRHISGRHRTLTIYRHAEPSRLGPKGRQRAPHKFSLNQLYERKENPSPSDLRILIEIFLSQKAYGLRSPFCRDKSFFVLCQFWLNAPVVKCWDSHLFLKIISDGILIFIRKRLQRTKGIVDLQVFNKWTSKAHRAVRTHLQIKEADYIKYVKALTYQHIVPVGNYVYI